MEYHIYDVYPYLHTAENVADFAKRDSKMFPVGGIHFIMRQLVASLSYESPIALCFDSESKHRNPILDGYKTNRKRIPAIIAQATYLQEILEDCGIKCYKGYAEADDYVYSLCEEFRDKVNKYDTIIIHSADKDLFHNVLEPNVVFETVNSNCTNVNYLNFNDVVKIDGIPIMYNTISLFKVLCYDKSDSIKPFTFDCGVSGRKVYDKIIEIFKSSDKYIPGIVSRNSKILWNVVKNPRLCGFEVTDNDISRLEKRVKQIYPKDMRNTIPGGMKFTHKQDVDMQKLCDYCYILKDYTSLRTLKRLGYKPSKEDDLVGISNRLFELGTDMANGAYHARNNMPLSGGAVFSETFSVREI